VSDSLPERRTPSGSQKNSACSDETTPLMTVTTSPATAPTTAASATVPASRARTQARNRRGTSRAVAVAEDIMLEAFKPLIAALLQRFAPRATKKRQECTRG
jgi:hypothetical protein